MKMRFIAGVCLAAALALAAGCSTADNNTTPATTPSNNPDAGSMTPPTGSNQPYPGGDSSGSGSGPGTMPPPQPDGSP